MFFLKKLSCTCTIMKYITIFAETNEHIKINRPINKIVYDKND